jgi:hypothetical protein
MNLVGEYETMAPTGALGAGDINSNVSLGDTLGVCSDVSPSCIFISPVSGANSGVLAPLTCPILESVTSSVVNVRKSRHPSASGSSRHFMGIEVKEERFFLVSGLFFTVTPFGKFGFCEGALRLYAGEQKSILARFP